MKLQQKHDTCFKVLTLEKGYPLNYNAPQQEKDQKH